jgi:hypothetical protein
VRGKLQIVVAAIAAASAFSAAAAQPLPDRVRPSTALPAGGWSARLFVSPADRPGGLPDDSVIRRSAPLGVNAQFSRRIAPGTRVSIDALNLFDRRSALPDNFLPPSAGRGVGIAIRKTF